MAMVKNDSASDEVKQPELLVSHIAMLCMDDKHSDITFVVDGEQIPAHRIILASRSEYFRALLYGGLKESTQTMIELTIPSQAFKCLLKYIYTGSLSLKKMKHEETLDILKLAHQFCFVELQKPIQDYLRNALSVANVCTTLNTARLLELTELSASCYEFMDLKLNSIMSQKTFRSIYYEGLLNLLKRDTFYAEEVDVFKAVYNWLQFNNVTSEKAEDLYKQVRFTLISREDLLNVVRSTNVLEPTRLLDIMAEKEKQNKLPYRVTPSTAEVNIPKSRIKWTGNIGVIDLGKTFITNSITLHCYQNCHSIHNVYDTGFVVEISVDNKQWTESVSCNNSTIQEFTKHFATVHVRYIKFYWESNKAVINTLKIKRYNCECSSYAKLK